MVVPVPSLGMGVVMGPTRLLAAPEGLTRPSGEAEVCQGGRALPCLRGKDRARRRLFPMGHRGRARWRLFPEPRVINTGVLFTSFGRVSLISIPDSSP
jgi:hypothetical protein